MTYNPKMDTDIFNGFPTHIEKAGGLLKISLQKDHKLGTFVENYLLENVKDLKSPRYIPKKEDLIQGVIGIGRYEDQQYYRIKILDLSFHNNVVNVNFIDYGNQAALSLSDIRLLNYEVHKALLNIPGLAITCFLENVSVNKPWNDDEFNTLKKLVLYEERQCSIRQLPSGVKVVNIFFHNANKKLTEMILENDLGTPISDAELLTTVKSMRNRLGYEDRLLSMPSPHQHRLANVNEHLMAERLVQTREPSSHNFSSAHMLPVGSSHNAYVSHMEDGPYSFSIQLKSSAEDALPRLTKLLKHQDPILNTLPLLPGKLVMTHVVSDNSFRRSIVMNVKRNLCQVYHMDYGSTEEVPFSEIYDLPSQAHHAPAMALRFCLADIKSMQITDSSKAYFQDLLQGKQVLIRVVKQESEGPLLQYCEMFYEGRNVKDILVAFNAPLEYTLQHPPRGKDIKVTVSHVESPSLFFIQYNSKLDLINNIQDAVNAYCKQHPRLRDLSGVNIGTPVGALFEDNLWYRAMIVSINTDNAQVLYIDYGNRSNIQTNQMCQISRDLVTTWRAQAVECCLQGFENEKVTEIDDEIIAAMEDILSQTFNMVPLQILTANRLLVELVDELGGKLSEKLMEIKSRSGKKAVQPVQSPDTSLNESFGSNQCQIDHWRGHAKPSRDNVKSSRDKPKQYRDGNQKGGYKSKSKNDNMFVRPSIRPIIEPQSTGKPSYMQHDDRTEDDQPKSFNREASFDKPRFPKNADQPDRGPRQGPPGGRFNKSDDNSNLQKKPYAKPSRTNTWEGDGSEKGDENSSWSDEKPKFSNRGGGGDRPRFNKNEGHGPKFNDKNDNSWSESNDDQSKWSGSDRNKDWGDKSDQRPRRDGGGRFSDKKSEDGSYGGNRFGDKRRDDESGGGRFPGNRRNDGESGGGRFGVRPKDGDGGGRFGSRPSNDGDSGGRSGGRSSNDGDGGSRFGGRPSNDGDRGGRFGGRSSNDGGDGGGRFGGRQNDGDGGGRFGGRRREDGDSGGRFGGKREDGENGGGRFGGRRTDGDSGGRFGGRRDAGEGGGRFGGRREDGGDRKGGRFNDGGGRKEGGRFGKENDFRNKKFDSDFGGDFKPPTQVSNNEDWDDSTTSTPVTKTPVITTVTGSYPPQNLQANTKKQVLLSSIANPHSIYVQEVNCESELEKLRSAIDSLGQALRSLKEDSLAPGIPVLARYSEDQALYRGLVKNVIPPGQSRVLFVDYGNLDIVPLSDLYYVPPEVLEKPPLAYNCTLSDLSPAGGKWPEDLSAYDTYFSTEENLTLDILSVKMMDGEMVIQSRLTKPTGESVSQKLIDGGIAVASSTSSTLPSPSQQDVPPTSQSMAVGNTQVPGTEETRPKIEGTLPDKWIDSLDLLVGQKLYAEILELIEERTFVTRIIDAKVVTLATLTSHQDPLCIEVGSRVIAQIDETLTDRLKVTLYGLDGYEKGITDGSEPKRISPICTCPVVRQVDHVSLAHIEGTILYIQRLADVERIALLNDEIFEFYNETTPEEYVWSYGDLCCAKSLLDENWYRAVVIPGEEKYKVKYLDYGNTEILPKENLRKLDKKFYFSEFALGVELAVDWETPCPPLLDYFATDEFISRIMRDSRGKWIVDLTFSTGERLVNKLVEMKLAKEKVELPFEEINLTIGSTLVAGNMAPILVSHADSPTMFWAHLQSHIHKVDELQEKLQAVVLNAEEATVSDKVFAAQYSADNVWYRATRVSDDTLRFIDYGNTDVLVSPKKLPEDLIKPLSGYAIPMHLCAKPINNDWCDESIKEFEMFIEQQNIIAEILNVDYKLVVDLLEGDKRLSKILIDAGYAVECDFKPESVKKYSQESFSDSCSLRIFSGLANDTVDKGIIDIQDTELLFSPESQGVPPTAIDSNRVFVTHSNSLNDFYIQEESCTDLIDQVANSLFESENWEKASELTIGSLYAVKYEDDLWYRCKLLSTEPEVSVLLLDYGNTFISSDLRIMPDDMISIAPLAKHCSLGVEDPNQSYETFITMINGGLTAFAMNVKKEGSPMIVQLLDNDKDVLSYLGIEETPIRQRAYITHVYGPDSFYAQTEEMLTKSDELAAKLLEAESFGNLVEIAEGNIIAALYPEDSNWYRALILSSAPDILVRFIDYGNTSIIQSHRDLPNDLKHIESLTLKCSLLLPESFQQLPDEITNLFSSLCTLNQDNLEIIFLEKGPVNIVDLYVNGESLTQTLINEIHKLVPEVDNGALQEQDTPIDSENRYTDVSEVNSNVKGYITHINSISNFYIQKEDCADLLNEIQTGLSQLEVNRKPDCGIGSLIAAKFIDGEWYRGHILQIDPEIRVRFIDYGNECNVSDIANLSDHLLRIPPVAMKSSLCTEGVTFKDNAKELFEKLCGDAETLFDFSIKSVIGDLNIVEIILDGKNVLSELITDDSSNTQQGNLDEQSSAGDDQTSLESMGENTQKEKGLIDKPIVNNCKLDLNEESHDLNSTCENNDIISPSEDLKVIPASEDHEVTPSSEDHEVIPSSEDHEVIPSFEDHEVIPSSEDHEVIPSSEDHEVIPASKDHEVIPTSNDPSSEVIPPIEEPFAKEHSLEKGQTHSQEPTTNDENLDSDSVDPSNGISKEDSHDSKAIMQDQELIPEEDRKEESNTTITLSEPFTTVESDVKQCESPSPSSNPDKDVQKKTENTVSPSSTKDKKTTSNKVRVVKSVAEIKANAKSRIVTRATGSSSADRKAKTNKSSPEPQLKQDNIKELQKPLFVKTNSFDEMPVPGCLSNPSSPVPSPQSTQEQESPNIPSTPE